MIFTADIGDLRERAKTLVMHYFVGQAQQDGVPSQLRAMYVRKLEEAKRVLADGESSLIAAEAALRGITPAELATVIVGMAESSDRLEIRRMEYNVRIEGTSTEAEIVEILAELDLTLMVDV